MPYIQLTPCLARGSICFQTRIKLPDHCTKASYDKEKALLVICTGFNGQHNFLRPIVRLLQEGKEIPQDRGVYSITAGFLTAELTSSELKATSKCCHSLPGEPIVKDTFASFDVTGCGVSSSPSAGNYSTSALRTRLERLFIDDCSLFSWDDNSTVENTLVFQSGKISVGFPGLQITKYNLESISVGICSPVLTLKWRIRIKTRDLKHIDLKLASLGDPDLSSSIAKHDIFVLRCKGCNDVVEQVKNAVFVSLPSELYTSVTGSTFCEECEPQLPVHVQILTEAPEIVYDGEDQVTLYRHHNNRDSGPSVSCNTCHTILGRYSDCSHSFVSYKKSHVSGFCGYSPGDIYWRHSPQKESIEHLQYHRNTKVIVGQLEQEVPATLNAKADTENWYIEIIKVVSPPDTFLVANKTVLEASRVLWRWTRDIGSQLPVKLPPSNFQYLLETLKQFSQEPESNTGYIPSILIAV